MACRLVGVGHYLNQCWNIVNWTPRNKVRLHFNRNSYIFIQENLFENVVWKHNVESPSMVDPRWNIWYWRSKWNLHTVCWDAVGCEWGTTSVYFGITYVCFIPSRLHVFSVEPQYRHQDFLFLSKVSFERHIQNPKKIHVGLKFEWCLWDQYEVRNVFRLRFSLVACVIASWELLMQTCWWPPTEVCSSTHLICLGLCGMAAWKLNGVICAMTTVILYWPNCVKKPLMLIMHCLSRVQYIFSFDLILDVNCRFLR